MNSIFPQTVNHLTKKISRLPFWILFNSKLISKLTNNSHVVCIGDSHISVFDYIKQHNLINNAIIDVLMVEGATAQGIVNPNSKTNALKLFKKRLKRAKRWQSFFFSLGEVDCGFVIWYRSEKYGTSIESQLYKSIENYIGFLNEAKQNGFQHIYVVSVPLPTIADGQTLGKVANLRQQIKASQLERTELTLRYNQLLKNKCLENGLNFIDVTTEQLDSHTNLIAQRFLNNDPLDHHLDTEEYSTLLVSNLKSVLKLS